MDGKRSRWREWETDCTAIDLKACDHFHSTTRGGGLVMTRNILINVGHLNATTTSEITRVLHEVTFEKLHILVRIPKWITSTWNSPLVEADTGLDAENLRRVSDNYLLRNELSSPFWTSCNKLMSRNSSTTAITTDATLFMVHLL